MKKHLDTLVLSYANPDLDTYSCALAYAELLTLQGYPAFAGTFGVPIPEVQFVLQYLRQVPLPELDPSQFDQFILVDFSWPGDLDDRVDPNKVVEIVDHRLGNDPDYFQNAQWNVELVGAAATLITEKFQAASIEPSQLAACLLSAGLISNSLNLNSPMTTDRDRKALMWLNQFAVLPANFAQTLFTAKSDVEGDKLYHQLYSDVTTPVHQGFGLSQIEMVGAEHVVHERLDEILASLDLIKADHQLHGAFATFIDIETKQTHFVTKDKQMQTLLAETLQLEFHGSRAVTPKICLRKQYIPTAKEAFLAQQSEMSLPMVA